MIQTLAPVDRLTSLGSGLFTLTLHAPRIAAVVKPGQFLNIKVSELGVPFLRRPFSVYHREGPSVTILFGVIGTGTSLLSHVKPGDRLDILGPLGVPFTTDDEYDTAILVGGGLGVAPLPLLTEFVRSRGKAIQTFLGARTSGQIVGEHLVNLHIATDDGTSGYRGTIVECLRQYLMAAEPARRKIFACGPTAMIKSLMGVTGEFAVAAEVSLESVMACGIGICQGCPVERTGGPKKYALICKDGTVFDITSIRLT